MLSHNQTKWLNVTVRNCMYRTRKQQQNSITSPKRECPVRRVRSSSCSLNKTRRINNLLYLFVEMMHACGRSCVRVNERN